LRGVPVITAGNINCECYPLGIGLLLPVRICSVIQNDFEDSLKKLLEILKHLKGPIVLIFSANGDFVLPDRFIRACYALGIKMIFMESNDQIDDKLTEIFLKEKRDID